MRDEGIHQFTIIFLCHFSSFHYLRVSTLTFSIDQFTLILPSLLSFLRFITTSFLILPIIYHLHLLSITGPYSVNGVPLRRVNQRYVIATNTSVSLAGVNVSAIEDDFFAREKVTKKVTTYPIYIPWYITSKNNHQRNPQIVGT